MSKNIKIIIGANFGDEGKGLATDYFSNKLGNNLVICHNGGSQKGHTVIAEDGIRHIFHHFGSGLLSSNKSDTYLSKDFILNPIIFNKEHKELIRKKIKPKVYVNKDCIITTPFDMFINQILEEYRNSKKHGSCGLGIYETIYRNENFFSIRMKDLSNIHYIRNLLYEIYIKYFNNRILELGINNISAKWLQVMTNITDIIDRYLEDLQYMINNVEVCDDELILNYDNIIFEGSQGLLLDKNNKEYFPNLTPSNTGILNPKHMIEKLGLQEENIEVIYITRTYLTRHGAGIIKAECSKNSINKNIIDLTNIPNEFQDELRYGILDINELYERIENDINSNSYQKSIMITHINEYDKNIALLEEQFKAYNVYKSNGLTRDSVK